jgi:hypothetical protein
MQLARASFVLVCAVLLAACGGSDDITAAPTSGSGGNAAKDSGTNWPSGGNAGATSAGGSAGVSTGGAAGEAGGGGSAGAPAIPTSCPRVRVNVPAGEVLNVRPSPATSGAPVGTLDDGELADVLSLVNGEALDGNDLWYEIETDALTGYVWSGLVSCTTDEPPVAPDGFYLPLVCNKSATVTQGNDGSYSHQGTSEYAFDFSLGIGTSMVAMADGSVVKIYDQTKPGDACYSGGGPSCATKANLVVLQHGDGTQTLYAHLSKVSVQKGDVLKRGTQVGLSGSTGYSTGPHAHVSRQKTCTSTTCQSIPMKFVDVPGDGVPNTGQKVTSGNCP